VGNLGRVVAHLADLGDGQTVVVGVDGIGEQELGAALGRVDFDRYGLRRAQENAVLATLRDDERPLLETVLPAKLGRHHDCPTFADSYGEIGHCRFSEIQNIRDSEIPEAERPTRTAESKNPLRFGTTVSAAVARASRGGCAADEG